MQLLFFWVYMTRSTSFLLVRSMPSDSSRWNFRITIRLWYHKNGFKRKNSLEITNVRTCKCQDACRDSLCRYWRSVREFWFVNVHSVTKSQNAVLPCDNFKRSVFLYLWSVVSSVVNTILKQYRFSVDWNLVYDREIMWRCGLSHLKMSTP